ncbi:MAG: hypothetical protein ACOCTM_03160 [Bacteroidota bacterium]
MAKTLSRIREVDITVIEKKEDGFEEQIMTVTVIKAPLGDYKRLSDCLKNLLNLLPEVLAEKGLESKEEFENYFNQMTTRDAIMLLPDMMGAAFDEVIKLLSLGTDAEVEELKEKVGIDEAMELFEAIIEVNKLIKVVEKGKNLMNLLGGIRGQNKKKKKK